MHPQGNILSILVVFAWIPLALWLARKWPPAKAASLLLLLPLMFLPERLNFKLPGLPDVGKDQIIIFWFFVAVLIFHRQRLRALRLGGWVTATIVFILLGQAVTVFLNADPISYGSVHIAGHKPYDAVHLFIASALTTILPFVLSAAMFNRSSDLRVLFRMLAGAALVYSLFQIIELRFSPQLHRWVYGYHQSYFLQARRAGGGFRPMVFMEHGLAVAMFTAVGVAAAAALYRAGIRILKQSAAWATAYLWLILLLSKSMAAFLYTLLFVPLILFSAPKVQFRVAMLLGIVVLSYPAVRGAGLVPVDDIEVTVTDRFGEERAESLMTRFQNEEKLLARANERPFFGWGTYCRPCIFHPWTGKETSIRDGDWIITYGGFGIVGYVGKYLLLLLPIFISARQRKRVLRKSDRRLLSALALIVAFSVFDLLPNGNFNYLVFALSGALLGCSRGSVIESARYARRKQEASTGRAQIPKPVDHPLAGATQS